MLKIQYGGREYRIKKGLLAIYIYDLHCLDYAYPNSFYIKISTLFAPYNYPSVFGVYPLYFYDTLIKYLCTENMEFYQAKMKNTWYTRFCNFLIYPAVLFYNWRNRNAN